MTIRNQDGENACTRTHLTYVTTWGKSSHSGNQWVQRWPYNAEHNPTTWEQALLSGALSPDFCKLLSNLIPLNALPGFETHHLQLNWVLVNFLSALADLTSCSGFRVNHTLMTHR